MRRWVIARVQAVLLEGLHGMSVYENRGSVTGLPTGFTAQRWLGDEIKRHPPT
jgi:hypothetical protein